VKLHRLPVDGCYLFDLVGSEDRRGKFLKTFHQPSFTGTPLRAFVMEEEFITTSNRNVFRGFHFQVPPAAHDKFVCCIHGAVTDYILDIRSGSPTYGKVFSVELTGCKPQLLFLPVGIAHAFLARRDDSALLYKTNAAYSPDHDKGLSPVGLDLQLDVAPDEIVISDRDMAFPKLTDFESPF